MRKKHSIPEDIFMKKKYVVIALFVLASILSVWLTGKVVINYNISDYLDESTETKISLNILKDEFGATGDIQVMVEDIDAETAKSIQGTLKAIPNVLNVSFDVDSEGSYKDGDALYVVLTNGDEYSDVANGVVADIKAALDDTFAGKTNYGGTVVEKTALRKAIQSEIVLILAVALCLVVAIMLLTSKSWLEPLILLLASGVAVLLNMGTNVIFGQISYITNAVAAILQLALSIDYSIVLLHQYRAVSAEEPDHGRAMMRAIKEVIKPVSASALTTVAGLLALLFMTLRIGFDIGIVLMKGIVISAVTSLTLLPALLLLFEKLLTKTKKKDLTLKGRSFCRFSFKFGKLVAPIALVLILACGVLQAGNSYVFTDSREVNQAILDRFGKNSTVLVVYPAGEQNYEKEAALAELLAAYKTADGKTPLKNYTAYSNTVRELYDAEKTAKALNIPKEDVELLLTMYHLYGEPARVKMPPAEFVRYAHNLLSSDSDVQELVSADTTKTLGLMLTVEKIMNGEHTAQQFTDLVAEAVGTEGAGLSLFAIRQMYGLYLYDQVAEPSVDFRTMLNAIVTASEDPDTDGLMDEATASALKQLAEGVDTFMTTMDHPTTQEEFRTMMAEDYGVEISVKDTAWLYLSYYFLQDLPAQETIPFLSLMQFLVDQGRITDPAAISALEGYAAAYEAIPLSYTYDEFLPALLEITENLTGEAPAVAASDEAFRQLYIMHFHEIGAIPDAAILGRTFVDFVKSVYPENDVVNSQLSEDAKAKLEDLGLVDTFLADQTPYDYTDMTTRLAALQESIQSLPAGDAPGQDPISGLYIKYAIDKDMDLAQPVMAFELLNFVADNMETNEFLRARMTETHRAKVNEARDNVLRAESMFNGENYSRMLLSVDLPAESADSSAFVEYLSQAVDATFGDEAHIAGEIVSTYDLQKTFDDDNRLISIFTIISIFVIILLVFRSLSLPVVLVAVIQGAIWISMSASLLTGPMFFMSYIMATCILMGATIDYGILMSTNYLQFRMTLDKKEALYKSVEAAMPTVFTSGLILTICGFVVGVLASQTSISTVGFLLGKGTLVSTLMITLVLPSVLYLLDGFILKLSMGTKKSKEPKH